MKSANVFRDRKFILLAVLVVLLVAVNLRQWSGSVPASKTAKESSASEAKPSIQQDPILIADQLAKIKPEFHEEKRNIFSFFQAPAASTAAESQSAEPPPPPQAVCGNSVCEDGEDITNCPTDCQPPPPAAPVITLRYIGYMSEKSGSVAFLTDGKEVFMARVNDVIANQYRVLKISEESIELGLLGNNQSSTIRFQGNQGG